MDVGKRVLQSNFLQIISLSSVNFKKIISGILIVYIHHSVEKRI